MDEQLHSFLKDDGTLVNPDLTPKPSLCAACKRDGEPKQEILCTLNRMDQQGESDFKCAAYEPMREYGENKKVI